MSNVIQIKQPREPSDLEVQLSIRPLEVAPLPVGKVSWQMIEEVAKLVQERGLALSPKKKPIAPSLFDAVGQQKFLAVLENPNADLYLELLLEYGLVVVPKD